MTDINREENTEERSEHMVDLSEPEKTDTGEIDEPVNDWSNWLKEDLPDEIPGISSD